jgi:hypothetical protein
LGLSQPNPIARPQSPSKLSQPIDPEVPRSRPQHKNKATSLTTSWTSRHPIALTPGRCPTTHHSPASCCCFAGLCWSHLTPVKKIKSIRAHPSPPPTVVKLETAKVCIGDTALFSVDLRFGPTILSVCWNSNCHNPGFHSGQSWANFQSIQFVVVRNACQLIILSLPFLLFL